MGTLAEEADAAGRECNLDFCCRRRPSVRRLYFWARTGGRRRGLRRAELRRDYHAMRQICSRRAVRFENERDVTDPSPVCVAVAGYECPQYA